MNGVTSLHPLGYDVHLTNASSISTIPDLPVVAGCNPDLRTGLLHRALHDGANVAQDLVALTIADVNHVDDVPLPTTPTKHSSPEAVFGFGATPLTSPTPSKHTPSIGLGPAELNRDSRAEEYEAASVEHASLGAKPTALSYCTALKYDVGMVSTKLGNIYYHGTKYMERIGEHNVEADPCIKDLRDVLREFGLCQRFNARHRDHFTYEALVDTAQSLAAVNLHLQPECNVVIWKKKLKSLESRIGTTSDIDLNFQCSKPLASGSSMDNAFDIKNPMLAHLSVVKEAAKVEYFFKHFIQEVFCILLEQATIALWQHCQGRFDHFKQN